MIMIGLVGLHVKRSHACMFHMYNTYTMHGCIIDEVLNVAHVVILYLCACALCFWPEMGKC